MGKWDTKLLVPLVKSFRNFHSFSLTYFKNDPVYMLLIKECIIFEVSLLMVFKGHTKYYDNQFLTNLSKSMKWRWLLGNFVRCLLNCGKH